MLVKEAPVGKRWHIRVRGVQKPHGQCKYLQGSPTIKSGIVLIIECRRLPWVVCTSHYIQSKYLESYDVNYVIPMDIDYPLHDVDNIIFPYNM